MPRSLTDDYQSPGIAFATILLAPHNWIVFMDLFVEKFQCSPTNVVRTPGRVNLIGEHTDYNGGFVLPTPIPQCTTVSFSARDDQSVRVATCNVAGPDCEYNLGGEKLAHVWGDFVQGATSVLRSRGFKFNGFNAAINSDIPLGSGLSSSASLSVCLLRGLRDLFHIPIEDVRLCLLAQAVENEFVGARVGIMDPLVCGLGEPGKALFIDTHSLEYQLLALPTDAELVVINSGISHRLANGDYNTRRFECESACELLGVSQLRSISPTHLDRLTSLPEPLNRRAKHVVTENQRVLDGIAAIQTNDLIALGNIFNASHDSQRDDYEVSIPEIDLLVNLARQHRHVFGARLTGGGFGGSIVILVSENHATDVAEQLTQEYGKQTGQTATVLVPPPDPLKEN